MIRVINDRAEWQAFLSREYPGVVFRESDANPPGVNAMTAGVLVGRFYTTRNRPFGVVFDQPRSCGGKS
jgi:hypothetical protein